MAKTDVYSWRLDPELKAELEEAARRKKVGVSAVLERAARDWLRKEMPVDDAKEQARLRRALEEVAGIVDGPGISATNKAIREAFRLKRTRDEAKRHGRRAR